MGDHTIMIIWVVKIFFGPFGACQALQSMGFSRQDYWNELPFLSPGDLPDPGIELKSPVSPALQVDSVQQSSLCYTISCLFFLFNVATGSF